MMYVSGISLDRFREIAKRVSEDQYEGNLIVHQDAHELGAFRFRGRLAVESSRGPGARRSWSGRHIPAACWHAYRDVLAELFEEYPMALVRTTMATYRGREGFRHSYPYTAYINVGSEMQPVTMPELCECTHGLYQHRLPEQMIDTAESLGREYGNRVANELLVSEGYVPADPGPPLSDEWGDGMTPTELEREMGLDPHAIAPEDDQEIFDRFEAGYLSAYESVRRAQAEYAH